MPLSSISSVARLRFTAAALLCFAGCTGDGESTDKSTDSASTATGGDEDGDGFLPSQGDCDENDATINPAASELCDGLDNDCDGTVDEEVGSAYYRDADQDGFGDPDTSIVGCEPPEGYVANATDCNDGSVEQFPGNTEVCDGLDNDCDGAIDDGVTTQFYADADGDGYGDPDDAKDACEAPGNYVTDATDCDDTTNDAFPGNPEVCDKIDNDCDGSVDEEVSVTYYADVDGDGHGDGDSVVADCAVPMGYTELGDDCDDTDEEVHPEALEVCNGLDDNCDGAIDEDTADDASIWYLDADGDSYGNSALATVSCEAPSGYVADGTDCDDAEASVNPAAVEYCNGYDDDCDGSTDEDDAADAVTWYFDYDADGYGNSALSDVECYQPTGYVADSTDCNDATSKANPGETEYCDGLDNDCDGATDEGDAADADTWYADADGDSWGDASTPENACSQPSGYVSNDDDCDDARAESYPRAPEYCNGYDDDCDGVTDEDAALDVATWYQDADLDGYGDASVSDEGCSAPAGYVADDTDCDDAVGTVNPGATEYCNGYDDDCDGEVDEDSAADADTWYRDADSDGYGASRWSEVACSAPSGYVATDGDCDDLDDDAWPGADEVCDGTDNNCDGITDEDSALDASTWYADADADGYGDASSTDIDCDAPTGYVADATDCDDGRADSHPGADEYCNGYDDDCDGTTDENSSLDASTWYQDVDADSYGDASVTYDACSQPSGYVADDSDCDDARALTNPGATEYCNSIDDDCDGSTDEDTSADATTWYRDADSDGYGDAAWTDVACSVPSGYVASGDDCDDLDDSAWPGATEVCDGVDNDCDGSIDEDSSSDVSTWYADADGDGYGDPASADIQCEAPAGYVSNDDDCDDGRDESYPGADEYCNGYDDDCDGSTDENDSLDATTWYQDADADSYGDASADYDACSQPPGYVADDTDCDDTRALTNPGATEYCNSIDDDCDGSTDEDTADDAATWYRDADSDGYGASAYTEVQCSAPAGYVATDGDCDDLDADAWPGADEVCDGVDNDCDGSVDEEGGVSDGDTWYADADGDEYGDADSTMLACSEPSGYVDNYYDCNDADSAEPVTVDTSGSAAGDGSLANPYDLIQDALDAANQCVVVFAGTYDEYDLSFSGKSIDLWGVEGYELTRIDPALATCDWDNPSDCHSVLRVDSGTGAAPTIHGFTISGGTGMGTSGSASTTCSDSDPSHLGSETCTVTTWEFWGGGAWIEGDDPEFTDVIFEGNVLPDFSQTSTGSWSQTWIYSYGGAVAAKGSLATFTDVTVFDNSADEGGGFWIGESASISLLHAWFDDNRASDGGALAVDNGFASVSNSVLACNEASTDGGGVFIDNGGTGDLTNTVFYDNEGGASATNGSAGYGASGTTLSVLNSIAEGGTAAALFMSSGTATLTYSDVHNRSGSDYGGTVVLATGSTGAGSLLAGITCDGNPWNDDAGLAGSGGVNAGDPNSTYDDSDGTRNDLGAYGGPSGDW